METIALFLVVIFGAIFVDSIKVVSAKEVLVIERFGKYYKSVESGIVILIPFVDKVKKSIRMGSQTINIQNFETNSLDNVTVCFDAKVNYSVIDAKEAAYGIAYLDKGIEFLVGRTILDTVAKEKAEYCLELKTSLVAEITKKLEENIPNWGCKLNEVEIEDIRILK